MKLLPVTLFLACVLAPLAAAGAVDGGFEEDGGQIVVTATQTERALESAPGAVEVLTAKQMEEMNALTVAEALEVATGLRVGGEPGRVQAPRIRGAKGKHTLVLIDGRRMAIGFRDMVDINQIPLVMVDRIEIVRGPSSSLYGSEAIGGVVNIITKKPSKQPSGGLNGQYGINKDGEADRYMGQFYAGNTLDRFSLIFSGEYNKNNGWDWVTDAEQPGGDKREQWSSAGRFGIDLFQGQRISGGFEYTNREMEGYRWMQNMYRDRYAEDERLNYYLQYDAQFAEVHSLMVRLNRSEYDMHTKITPPSTDGMELPYETYLNQAELRWTSLLFNNHLLSFGAEIRGEGIDRGDDTRFHTSNASGYFQDEYQVFRDLHLVVGVRFDEHSEFGGNWAPKVSAIYTIHKHLRAKASYGQGFRAPNMSELFVDSTRKKGKEVYRANRNLDAEKSENYEIGLEGEYRQFQGSVFLFRNDVDDLIDVVFEETIGAGPNRVDYYIFENIADARLQGLEFAGSVRLPHGFSVAGNLTWLDAEDRDTGKELTDHHKLKTYLKLGYDNKQYALHGNLRMNYIKGGSGGYSIFNLYGSKGLGKGFKVYAGVDNVLDKNEGPPTFFYTGVNFSF